MKTYLYRLRFNSPIHFGLGGLGLESTADRLSSDSLTSALINAFSLLGNVDGIIQSLQSETPSFILSSLFPFGPSSDGTRTVYGLPRPLSKPTIAEGNLPATLGKDFKRIKYLEQSDFFAWLGSVPLHFEEMEAILERSSKLSQPRGSGKGVGWWSNDLRPRAALDRVNRNSNLWFCETLRFRHNAGLYGLVKISGEEWKNKLTAAFGLLGELGVGGERTYGMGTFKFSGFEIMDNLWRGALSKKNSRYVLLSNYYPAEGELINITSLLEAWDFTEIRGYVVSGRTTTSAKRKRIRMITEGSVLKRPVRGTIVDVTPEDSESLGLTHRVYRSGLAFLMP